MNTLKRVLALSLAVVMVLSYAVLGAFTDEENIPSQNKEAVALLSALSIMNGYEDNTFRPDGNITRAEAAKMIYVLCNNGVDDGATIHKDQNIFTDLRADAWYEGYVNYCYNVGIIAGRGNGTFDPEGFVTSYELMKMLLVVAEYKPEIQGYVGASWQANVLRDAQSSGMLKGFEYSMTAAAPRHWAARLFYNTILDVDAALYIGDALITNPNLVGGAEKYMNTVGQKRLGLVYAAAEVTGTMTARLGDGSDVYKTSILDKAKDNDSSISKKLEVNFEIPNEYLGREVRVVYKLKNPNIEANASNITVYSVYPTGNDEVVETTFNDITTKVETKSSAVAPITDGIFSIKFKGYNNNSKVKIYLDNTTDENTIVFNSKTYGNDFEKLDVGSIAEDLKDYWGAYSGDTVRVILDSNGDLKHIFVTETNYYRVTGKTTNKVTFQPGKGSIVTADVEDIKTSDELERGDIVAIVEDYSTGECVYNVRKIESTEVEATDWDGDVVILNKEEYGLNIRAAMTDIDSDHAVYYLDKGTVVFSEESKGGDKVPSSTAMITEVGPVDTVKNDVDNTLYDSFKVKYITADGKTATKIYDVDEAFGEANILYSMQIGAGPIGTWTTAHATALRTAVIADMNNGALVKIVTTDDGVYFKKYDKYENAGRGVTTAMDYKDKDKELSVGNLLYSFTENTTVFARYIDGGDTKYKVLKGSELKSFKSGVTVPANCSVISDDKGNVMAAYIDFTTDLPTETSVKTYFVLTGKSRESKVDGDWEVAVQVIDMNGDTKWVPVDTDDSDIFDLDATFAAPANNQDYMDIVTGDFENIATTKTNDSLKLVLVEYTVKDGMYTLETQTDAPASTKKIGKITAATDDYIVIDGSKAKITEDTAIFYVANEDDTDKIYAYGSPMTATHHADAAFAIVIDGEVAVVYVNGNEKTVYDTTHTLTDGLGDNIIRGEK